MNLLSKCFICYVVQDSNNEVDVKALKKKVKLAQVVNFNLLLLSL